MIEWHDRLGSTMDAAHARAAAGAPHGTGVAAREQTAARGRRGRPWVSPRGGLWLSVIVRPAGEVPECLSLRVGLATADVLERLHPDLPPLELKWPNDLYLDGRKLGGILCEARWDANRPAWVVVGIGLNLTNPLPAPVGRNAIALGELVPHVTADALAAPVAEAVARIGLATGPLTDAEVRAYAARDRLRGRRVRAPRPGLVQGIAPDGALLVEHADGVVHRVRAGDPVVSG